MSKKTLKPKAKTAPVSSVRSPSRAKGVAVKEAPPGKPAKTGSGKAAPVKPAVIPAKASTAKTVAPAPAKAGAPPAVSNDHRLYKPGKAEAQLTKADVDLAILDGHLPDDELRKVKTGLGKRDLEQFRKVLLEKRAEILGDVASLQDDSRGNSHGGNLSNMPLHMADVGSDHYEQEFTLGLVESERKLLREIDDALVRIDSGTFGVCLLTAVPISRPRLEAKPWARYCIAVVRELERRGKI